MLTRAFVTLGTLFGDVPNPRAWLFRVASNLWIDRVRRRRFELAALDAPLEVVSSDTVPGETREAAGTLLVRLSPQERTAVVLRDVFDFSVEDIAQVLATTQNAVKAALHRGRDKLQAEPAPVVSSNPAPGALDAFCEAFISHVRNYFFTPDVIADVCAELGVPYRVNGYRYWPTGQP